MSHLQFPGIKMLILVLASGILLSACGGGGSSLSDVGSGGTGFISGNVTAGPVSSANVIAYAVTAGQMGAQIGKATTDTGGNVHHERRHLRWFCHASGQWWQLHR